MSCQKQSVARLVHPSGSCRSSVCSEQRLLNHSRGKSCVISSNATGVYRARCKMQDTVVLFSSPQRQGQMKQALSSPLPHFSSPYMSDNKQRHFFWGRKKSLCFIFSSVQEQSTPHTDTSQLTTSAGELWLLMCYWKLTNILVCFDKHKHGQKQPPWKTF